jgi:hypothetical protein
MIIHCKNEFRRRNDLGGNIFLLIRCTGMQIGECSDLSCDCFRSTRPHQWAIHVPLGKLQTERMIPVDSWFAKCPTAAILPLAGSHAQPMED